MAWGASWGSAQLVGAVCSLDVTEEPDTVSSGVVHPRKGVFVSTPTLTVFAYSKESLRVATKVSYPGSFVTTSEASAHVKPIVAKVIAGKKARIKSTGSSNKQYSTEAVPIRASVVSRQQSARVTQSDGQPVFVSRTRVH